jgi:RimJ/RimL family protein N-acetyltransferase
MLQTQIRAYEWMLRKYSCEKGCYPAAAGTIWWMQDRFVIYGADDIKPFSCKADYGRMIDYFLQADKNFLIDMGVDPGKLPSRNDWLRRLLPDLERPDCEKQTYFLSWLHNGVAIGHSNVSKIRYGEEAYIHLHIWVPECRRVGMGTEFLRQSANTFIRKFALKSLYSEPYAENPAPNRALSKLGFRFIKRYWTVPGFVNFDQEVNQYVTQHEI